MTVTPPLPAAAAPAVTGPGGSLATLVKASPALVRALAALAARSDATPLVARVDAALSGGLTRLSSPLGDLVVRSTTPSPPGASVTVVLQSGGGRPLVRLLPGGLAPGPAPKAIPALGSDTPSAAVRTTAPAAPSATSAAPAAMVAPPPPGGTTPVLAATALTPVRVPGTPPPTAPGGIAAAPLPNGAPAAPSAPLPAGTRLAVRVHLGAAPTPAPTAAPQLAGHVIAPAEGGQSIVRLLDGLIALHTRTPLPEGRVVVLEPLPTATPPPPADAGRGSAAQAPWPGLDEALATVATAAAAPARREVVAAMPRPTDALGAAMMLFVRALRSGEPADWLGDGPLRLLHRHAPHAAARLGEKFREAARAFDAPPGEWRTATLPLLGPAGWTPVHLMLRGRRQRRTDAKRADDAARFVVDVRLSRLGRLQLDGLVPARDPRFDLLVRSEGPLPGEVRDGIRGVFADMTATAGWRGQVGFRAAPPDFIETDVGGQSPSSGVIV